MDVERLGMGFSAFPMAVSPRRLAPTRRIQRPSLCRARPSPHAPLYLFFSDDRVSATRQFWPPVKALLDDFSVVTGGQNDALSLSRLRQSRGIAAVSPRLSRAFCLSVSCLVYLGEYPSPVGVNHP